MKISLQDKNIYILQFDLDEDVIEGLKVFAKQEGVDAGFFTGLGAASEVIISYYDLHNKKYLDKTIKEDVEIASLTGNIAWMGSDCIIHAHGVFSRSDYKGIAGHVKKLVVSATCEIHLTKLHGEIKREFDERTGLNLLKCFKLQVLNYKLILNCVSSQKSAVSS